MDQHAAVETVDAGSCMHLRKHCFSHFKQMASTYPIKTLNSWQRNDMKTLNALQLWLYLGVGLTNVLHTFNPQAVILRNKVIESQPTVLSVIQDEVSSRMDAQFSSRVELLPSSLGHNAPALGMTSLVTEAFLHDATLSQ